MISFLRTKIGMALVIALVIVTSAFILKIRNEGVVKESGTALQVSIIANKSVQRALDNGEINSKQWEETLKNLISTTTIDEKIASFSQNTATSTNKPLTATDLFAQAFFTKYLELKKSGAPIDENTGISLVNELLADDYGGPQGEKIYTVLDIETTNTISTEGMRRYINDVGEVFTQPLPENYENELIIINRVNSNGSKKDLPKLSQNIARYVGIQQELLLIPVPKDLKNTHLALINSLSFIIEGVKGMLLIESDPVGATRMIVKYDEGLKMLDLSTKQLTQYISQKNIKFSSSEPGRIFKE